MIWKKIASLATHLDMLGLFSEADIVDRILVQAANPVHRVEQNIRNISQKLKQVVSGGAGFQGGFYADETIQGAKEVAAEAGKMGIDVKDFLQMIAKAEEANALPAKIKKADDHLIRISNDPKELMSSKTDEFLKKIETLVARRKGDKRFSVLENTLKFVRKKQSELKKTRVPA